MQALTKPRKTALLIKKSILTDDSRLSNMPLPHIFAQGNQLYQNTLFSPSSEPLPKFSLYAQQPLSADELLKAKQIQNINNAFVSLCRRRWQQEIYNRFRESRQRFPEFFPCFELRETLDAKLEYSIHFQPLTKYAKVISSNNPLFPNSEEFKPIEQLWNSEGKSQLDIIFEHYPTQLALKSHKTSTLKLQRQKLIHLIQNYVKRLEISHIKFGFQRKAAL
ncbi:hypothetical protein Glo7428_0300 [Gloeocapsa sp. PCC 7428]|uniref:hypothetical protein n=1 Tax=Gloeocapsa sp. PCC 7428 TaxID=1173026 RepID=UPI0002A5DF3C|nr:hypothetical protein [Gloeocapsa sp. PCC 7428]AFZ28909.1 hypothetical protein Glo7428_0300 [Gloeocapsa sp. PCC 7428]